MKLYQGEVDDLLRCGGKWFEDLGVREGVGEARKVKARAVNA